MDRIVDLSLGGGSVQDLRYASTHTDLSIHPCIHSSVCPVNVRRQVVTELLQFAAVMSPNNDAPAPRAKSNEDTKKQMEKMLQSGQ